MLEVLVRPFRILAKVFHPCVGNTITKDETAFNHFKAKLACTVNAIPGPAILSECTEVASKGQDTVKEEDTALDEMSNASKNIPGPKGFSG